MWPLGATDGVFSGKGAAGAHLLDSEREPLDESRCHGAQGTQAGAEPVAQQHADALQGKGVIDLAVSFFSSTRSCAKGN